MVYFKPDTIDLQKYIISFLPKLKDKSINFDNITPKF